VAGLCATLSGHGEQNRPVGYVVCVRDGRWVSMRRLRSAAVPPSVPEPRGSTGVGPWIGAHTRGGDPEGRGRRAKRLSPTPAAAPTRSLRPVPSVGSGSGGSTHLLPSI
jgi:hypothetical protein